MEPIITEVLYKIKPHFVDEQIMIVNDISNNHHTQQNFEYIAQEMTLSDSLIRLIIYICQLMLTHNLDLF